MEIRDSLSVRFSFVVHWRLLNLHDICLPFSNVQYMCMYVYVSVRTRVGVCVWMYWSASAFVTLILVETSVIFVITMSFIEISGWCWPLSPGIASLLYFCVCVWFGHSQSLILIDLRGSFIWICLRSGWWDKCIVTYLLVFFPFLFLCLARQMELPELDQLS